MSGSGNDFILIDNRDGRIKDNKMGPLVAKACRRRWSVGADGVIFVINSADCDFGWRFFNADGGEVEMCGNGGRCVSRFAYLKGIAGPRMTFETMAGPMISEVNGRAVKVLLPNSYGPIKDPRLDLRPEWLSVDFINSGVPHVVVQVADLRDHPVVDQGRAIRYHDNFLPAGTNADFMQAVGPNRLKIRTYERGVEDETLACGTGAVACALIAAAHGVVNNSPVHVKTRSGETLTIHFHKKEKTFEQVALEGGTAIIYKAKLNDEALLA